MAPVVIVSICSKAKDPITHPIPARERYTGTHVRKVEEIAKSRGVPFLIFSGAHGLVSAEDPVRCYSHLLSDDEAERLVVALMGQIRNSGIQKIEFYTQDRPNWTPYRKALTQAMKSLSLDLVVYSLSDDD